MSGKRKSTKAYIGPWWRAYSGDLDSYVLQTLPDAVFRVWFNLGCLASLNNGVLPDHYQIAYRLRIAPHDLGTAIDILIEAGLVEQTCTPGRDPELRMSGWDRRQYARDLSTERVRKFRAKAKGETVPETASETVKPSSSSPSRPEQEDREYPSREDSKPRRGSDYARGDGDAYRRAKDGEGAL
jgi:hypothetical protein